MTNQKIDEMLATRIPYGRRVGGLHYGAHISQSMSGWCGYYVRVGDKWGVAKMTPADDELVGGDAEILDAIAEEMAVRSASTEDSSC